VSSKERRRRKSRIDALLARDKHLDGMADRSRLLKPGSGKNDADQCKTDSRRRGGASRSRLCSAPARARRRRPFRSTRPAMPTSPVTQLLKEVNDNQYYMARLVRESDHVKSGNADVVAGDAFFFPPVLVAYDQGKAQNLELRTLAGAEQETDHSSLWIRTADPPIGCGMVFLALSGNPISSPDLDQEIPFLSSH
jgi:hypothetical protein